MAAGTAQDRALRRRVATKVAAKGYSHVMMACGADFPPGGMPQGCDAALCDCLACRAHVGLAAPNKKQ